MERIAGEVEGVHFGIGDLDAFFIGSLIEHALDLEARLGCRGADEFDDGDAIRQRRPRQFCVIWQNRRCSIRFHFDVPGG